MSYKNLDDRQVIQRSALPISIGSSANTTLDSLFTLIDSKMVNLAGTQTLINKTINGNNNTLTVLAGTQLSGVTPIANGGTDNGTLPVTAGGVIYTDGTRFQNTGAGTAGQSLTSTGTGSPVWGSSSGAPVGATYSAFLTLAQMQGQVGTGWVLAEGQTVSGSAYESITGGSSIGISHSATATASGVTLTYSQIFLTTTGNTAASSNQLTNLAATSGISPGDYVNVTNVPAGTTVLSIGNYTFTVSSANATAGATYTNNGHTFTVVNTIVAGTSLVASGTGAPTASGTLTLASGTGDATITFSSVVGSITMSANATSLLIGTTVIFSIFETSFTGMTNSNSTITMVSNTSGITPGPISLIFGAGIPFDTTINSVTVTTVPDCRAVVIRGKDNGRGLDPNGDLALGTYEADSVQSHNHGISDPSGAPTANGEFGNGTGNAPGILINSASNNYGDIVTTAFGGNETRGKSIIANIFIRIN